MLKRKRKALMVMSVEKSVQAKLDNEKIADGAPAKSFAGFWHSKDSTNTLVSVEYRLHMAPH